MTLLTFLALAAGKEAIDKINETIKAREAQKIEEDPLYLEKKREKAEQREKKWAERAEKLSDAFNNWEENQEQKRQEKRRAEKEEYDNLLNSLYHEFSCELIFKTESGWLDKSRIYNSNGEIEYRVEANHKFGLVRTIEIYNSQNKLVASAQAYNPNHYEGHLTYPNYNITVSDAKYDIDFRRIGEYRISPCDWISFPVKKRICYTISDKNNEKIAAAMTTANDNVFYFFMRKDDNIDLYVILLIIILSAFWSLSPAYDRYLYRELSTARSG